MLSVYMIFFSFQMDRECNEIDHWGILVLINSLLPLIVTIILFLRGYMFVLLSVNV